MPALVVLIAPLLALYVKFRLVAFAVKIIIFTSIYLVFKNTMQWVINIVFSKMNTLDFPCMVSYILNSLDIFPMVNFALSLMATIYIGRFLLNLLSKFINA